MKASNSNMTTQGAFERFALEIGVRGDWHEPDEQDVTARVVGRTFDNAGVDGEMEVRFYKKGLLVGTVNLATLCAFATGFDPEDRVSRVSVKAGGR